jgi:tetratricopeptide (TPR) repeat protein
MIRRIAAFIRYRLLRMPAAAGADNSHADRAVSAAFISGPAAGDADRANELGVAELTAGRYELAREHFLRAIGLQPHSALAYSNLAIAQARLGAFEAAADAARRALERDPDLDEAHITLAESLVIAGELDEAQHHFHAAAATNAKWRIAAAVRFDPAFLDQLNEEPEDAAELDIRLDALPGPNVGPVLLVSCDPRYCRLFFGPLIESLAATGSSPATVHLHLIGDDSELIGRLRDFCARYPGLQIAVSVEPDPAGLDDAQRRVYFTCGRFLVLRRLLAHYRRPICVADVDAVFRGPLADVADAVQDVDVGLYLRRPQRIVWTNVAAGRLMVNPTAGADAYLRVVESYIRWALRQRQADWFLDQVALYCSLTMLRRCDRAPTTRELNDELDRVMYAFATGYAGKIEDPLYAAYFVQI